MPQHGRPDSPGEPIQGSSPRGKLALTTVVVALLGACVLPKTHTVVRRDASVDRPSLADSGADVDPMDTSTADVATADVATADVATADVATADVATADVATTV